MAIRGTRADREVRYECTQFSTLCAVCLTEYAPSVLFFFPKKFDGNSNEKIYGGLFAATLNTPYSSDSDDDDRTIFFFCLIIIMLRYRCANDYFDRKLPKILCSYDETQRRLSRCTK